ncbi:SURF1 family cytochrome oxidase biogenesis protein [Variovorax sp. S12S4]|uniref:SURF1 family cytochrome oxidase biogenesis protein n=1 Tax=Variovorax sp. S12S4 TaxID=3029170 RepID=UPI0031593AAE
MAADQRGRRRIPSSAHQRHFSARQGNPGAGQHPARRRLLGADAAAGRRWHHGAGQPRLRAARGTRALVAHGHRAQGRDRRDRPAAHHRAQGRVPAQERPGRRSLVLARRAGHCRRARPGQCGALLHRCRGHALRPGCSTGMARWGLTVIAFPNSHLVYAITWYGLTLMVAGAAWFVWRDDRRRRKLANPADSSGDNASHADGRQRQDDRRPD